MKNTKRKIAQFTFYDRTGIQKLLEKEAQKGWMLEKISPWGWKFRRIEPAKIHFAVTYFPQASMFDPEPTEKQKNFWALCEHTGWHLASHNAQMQIFYNERENPIPIETDAAIELENIESSAKKSFLTSYYLLTGCTVLQMALGIWQYITDPVGYLSRNSNLFSALCWSFLMAMCLIEIIGYFTWRNKARKAIEETGIFTATKGYRNIELAFMWVILAIFAVFLVSIGGKMAIFSVISALAIMLVATLVWGFSNLLKKFKISANANRIITIITVIVMSFGVTGFLLITVIDKAMESGLFDREYAYTYEYKGHTFKVYDDELPLMVQDMVETDYDDYSTSWYGDESLFMSCHDAYQRPKMGDLDQYSLQYTLVKIKFAPFYNIAYRYMLKDFPNNRGITEEEPFYERAVEIPASEWGAQKAYQLYIGTDYPDNEYLLCYEDAIIMLRPDMEMELTQQVKAAVAEKIGGVVVCHN